MICQPCCDRHHDQCKGGTWCDCQHQPPGTGIPGTTKAAHPVEGQTA